MPMVKPLMHILRTLPFKIDVSLSNTEFGTLNALIGIDGGNAYRVWQNSGLKHYPTVLRALKKLKGKGLVDVLEKTGERGEKFYVQTFLGTLVPPIVNQNTKKVFNLLAKRSVRFEELVLSEIEETKVYEWAVETVSELAKSPKADGSQNLNKILERLVFDDLGSIIVGVLNYRENETELSEILTLLKHFATVSWVKNLIEIHLNEMIDDVNKDQKNLERFKQELSD